MRSIKTRRAFWIAGINKMVLITFAISSLMFAAKGTAQDSSIKKTIPAYKFSVSTTWLTFANWEPEEQNVHMYEFHFGYKITPKDKIELKVATWKLFEPMGIQFWDPQLQKESEFYPGRLRESGIGITYQRMLWKGLFAQIEILPLWKIYLDDNNKKIADGFKLYTTYHLGYHVPLFKDRLYLEPQVHCNYWPIDSKAPQGFQAKDSKWPNYFLFEPNLYIGVSF
jgi:hypothetical protein